MKGGKTAPSLWKFWATVHWATLLQGKHIRNPARERYATCLRVAFRRLLRRPKNRADAEAGVSPSIRAGAR